MKSVINTLLSVFPGYTVFLKSLYLATFEAAKNGHFP